METQLAPGPSPTPATVGHRTPRGRVFGHSNAALIPQRVGNWWVQPIKADHDLPPRARARLNGLIRSGIALRGIVLFHEIAAAPTLRRAAEPLGRGEPMPDIAVIVDECVRALSGLISLVRGRVASIRQAKAEAAARRDPCLVVVTEDGTWIEVDRWYE